MCVFLNSLPIVVELNNSNYIEKLNGYLCNSKKKLNEFAKLHERGECNMLNEFNFFRIGQDPI